MTKKVQGFKEFMKTPRQLPAPPGGHPVPPGYKRVRDHIAGWKLVKVQEGMIGKVASTIAKDMTAHLPKTAETARLTAKKATEIEDLGRATVAGGSIVAGAAAVKKMKDLKKKEKVQEGIGGALIGGALGGLAAGPLGIAAGAMIGHKATQRASQNPSVIDAMIASKTADVIDRVSARRAAKKGKPRFMPTIASRYLRNIAASKAGGMYSIGGDTGERVGDYIDTPANRQKPKPKKAGLFPFNVKSTKPAPAAVAAKVEVNPEHQKQNPGHGELPSPFLPRAHETEAGQAAAARRKAVQAAIAARIKASEKQKKTNVSSNFDAPGTRQKKEAKPSSSTILVPEEKGK